MDRAVKNRQRTLRISPPKIEKALRTALTYLERKDRGRFLRRRLGLRCACPALEVGVLLISDRRMRELNRRYRGKATTTDVLSFPLIETPGDGAALCPPETSALPLLLGDIVISLPQARRQARAYGAPLYEEIFRLLVHGLLHLLGYDHERGRSPARTMKALEEELLAALKERHVS